MKLAVALLITAFAALTVLGQGPTLHVVTEIPNLPSDLYYGTTKVKPLRLRPGTNTPITIDGLNDSDFFVNQQYVDFLNRFPDQSGFDFWVSQTIPGPCGGNTECWRIRRDNTSGAFFLSIEFQATGYLAERMYKVAYGDADGTSTLGGAHQLKVPIIKRSEFLPDTLQLSSGVVVDPNNNAWQIVLENNKIAYANAFVARPRFTAEFPASMTPAQFVDKLNTNGGNNGANPLSQSERDQLVQELTLGTKTRAQVVRAVAEDQDLINSEKNKAFVLMQYLGYLRRDPNAGQDTDHTGYEFWLQKLNTFGGNFHQAQMVRAFIVSGEYLNRF